jgi:hypothetical protein
MKTVINIVEVIDGIPIGIKSHIVESDCPEEIEKVENKFWQIAVEHGAEENDKEVILDNAYYDIGNYNVYLMWSNDAD